MAQLSLNCPIVFFDLETTGTSPVRDRIVEIALVRLNCDGTRETFASRVNPGVPIPPECTAIHGITDEDVKSCPPFKQIARRLYDWMKGADLGGYNAARFDLPMLAEEFMRAGVVVDFEKRRMVDVQQIFFKMEQRTLSAAYRFYCKKEIEGAHGAEADTLATIEVLEAQLDHYQELVNDVHHLHKFLSNGDEIVDYDRKMVKKGDKVLFNFGKHKDKCVEEVLQREPGYYDWIMGADFSLHTKQKLSEILNKMKLGSLVK